MAIDWSTTAACVGALGGLSGFTSLTATWWWRRQDQRKLVVERISVDRVGADSFGLSFWVRYSLAPSSESVKAEIRVLGGDDRAGPYIEGYVQTPYDPAGGTVERVPPTGSSRTLGVRLGRYLNDPPDVCSAWVVVHGKPPPKDVRLRITVRGEASGTKLATRVLHVAP